MRTKYPLVVQFIAIYLISQLATRAALCIFAIKYDQIDYRELLNVTLVGELNDIISLSYVVPFLLILSLSRRCSHGLLNITLCFIAIFLLTSNLFGELGFWDEFGVRYNFIAVDYLIYTQEIIGTLNESFPLGKIITALVVFSGIMTYIVTQKLFMHNQLADIKRSTSFILITITCGVTYTLFKFYDSDKWVFTNNAYARELAKNGPYEFFSAFRNNELNYTKFYKTIDNMDALQIVRHNIVQPNQQFLSAEGVERNTIASSKPQKYNIILITIESMSAEYMGKFGHKEHITPNLDRIADESIFFTKTYAAGTRTVRGLEAVTLGLPPTPGSAIIRRQKNYGLFNIGSVLRLEGYETNFFYGGFSYFDNLENYFTGNGYKVTDRNNLSTDEISFTNIWGVADEDILTKALKIADDSYAAGQAFFSLIMTTSNHRPYTFPEGRIDRPSGKGGRLAAVKYTDYAIGKFIEDAKTKPWFENTIFIITADHCASSAGKVQLPVNKYHIPLIIYAPKILKPAIIDNVTSQIDIPPTILGLLNISYKSKFIGKDAIHFPAQRAFISTYQLLGYIKDDHLVILAPKRKTEVYKISDDKQILVHDRPDLINEAIAFYQTSFALFSGGGMRNE